MRTRLFATTAISLAWTTAAFAQLPAPTAKSADTPSRQSQTSAPADNSATSSPTATTPAAGQAASSPSSSPSTAAQNPPSTSTSNPSAAGTGTNQAAGSSAPNANSTTTSQAPSNSGSTSQAQTPPNATTSPNSTTSSQQTANPPATSSNQAQQAPSGANTNTNANTNANTGTAQQQPANSTGNTAQSSSSNVNASVNINDQQRTRINQSVARLDVRPLNSVNFSLSVGTTVPRDVHLSTLPADVAEIVPQYRGYSFVLVKDQIVIVDPQNYQIVTTLPYGGASTAAAPARERSKVSFSDRDRDVIRKHARTRVEGRATESRTTESRTTGSSARTQVRVGDRVPDTVEIESFPDEVYRESPSLREYRYMHRDNRTYVIEPQERRIIEEID
jgi:hypothetical protein